MAERAHPQEAGFKDRWLGLKKSRYKKLLYERYAFCNKYIKDKKVLDIPSGVGWGTSLLKGAVHITGIDISTEAIEYAVSHYQNRLMNFMVGTMQKIGLPDNSVDVVICLEGFEHVDKNTGISFLGDCKRVLVHSGILILTCPVLDEKGRNTVNPYHISEYPEEELAALFNSNFRIQSFDRIAGPDGPEYRAVLVNFKKGRYAD